MVAFDESSASIADGRDSLALAMSTAFERASSAWPTVRLPRELVERQLARAVAGTDDPVAALRELHADDLYFAVACAEGNGEALAAFDRQHAVEIVATLRQMGLSPSACDETLQVMREELFVATPGTEPRILKYSGRGHLKGWLRAVAARTGLRVGRRDVRLAELHESSTGAAGDDLELDYLKRTYGVTFKTAFRAALAQLATKDRILLRQRFQHQLGIEQMGALYGVHESTISRWVTDARERLVARTRDEMMKSLDVGRAEVSSILRLIRSHCDITLSSLAADDESAGVA